MTEVKFEKFNNLTAIAQGRDIRDLIKPQRDWLEEVQPGTVRRYENIIKAAKNVARLATSSALEAYIIRKNEASIGLGTIIFEQRVTHPDEGIFAGDDLDYWVNLGEEQSVHEKVAKLLIDQSTRMRGYKAGRMLLADTQHIVSYQAMASVVEQHPNPARGFANSMRAVGEPAILSTDIPGDPFGMARNGKPAQLYSLTFDI